MGRRVFIQANGFTIHGDCPKCSAESVTVEEMTITDEVTYARVRCNACKHLEVYDSRPAAIEGKS